jgi:hypothetical protein
MDECRLMLLLGARDDIRRRTGILERIGAFFFEAADASVRTSETPPAEDASPAVEAAILGPPAAVVPVAAACAGELRARARAPAALVCIWRPQAPEHERSELAARSSTGAWTASGVRAGTSTTARTAAGAATPAARTPAGAATPAARRLAARLADRDLAATACGRIAWLALDAHAEAAASEFRRCRAAAGGPLVIAVGGPRPQEFEPLLREVDLCVAVLQPDIDPALRDLALAGIPSRTSAVVAPLPPGPPRWAAMAGLARLRSLPETHR